MSSVGASIKPFLAGAITALSALFVIQQYREKVRKCRQRQEPSEPASSESANPSSTTLLMDSPYLDQRMIRKAEGAIRKRTSRLTIVVERCTNDHNYSAILRTAEALGVQHVWIIAPPAQATMMTTLQDDDGNENGNDTIVRSNGQVLKHVTPAEIQARTMHHLFARKALEWLSVREFPDTTTCLQELRRTNHTVWATDLSQEAKCLTQDDLPITGNGTCIPVKLAIVFGTEAVGCTQEMLQAADLRVYLPLRGFADSLNLSVATALVIHQLFVLDPSLEGAMLESERCELRQKWFAKLAMQRLLTSRQKKNRTNLVCQITACQDLDRRRLMGEELDDNQMQKIAKLVILEKDLQDMDARLHQHAVVAVQDLVASPPEPITDMRRANEHRTWFGGRNTRKMNGDAWADMPATTGYQTTVGLSTADFFRGRVAESKMEESET